MLKKSGYVEGSKSAWPAGVPQLPQLFYAGQLVRCIVTDQVDAAPHRPYLPLAHPVLCTPCQVHAGETASSCFSMRCRIAGL